MLANTARHLVRTSAVAVAGIVARRGISTLRRHATSDPAPADAVRAAGASLPASLGWALASGVAVAVARVAAARLMRACESPGSVALVPLDRWRPS